MPRIRIRRKPHRVRLAQEREREMEEINILPEGDVDGNVNVINSVYEEEDSSSDDEYESESEENDDEDIIIQVRNVLNNEYNLAVPQEYPSIPTPPLSPNYLPTKIVDFTKDLEFDQHHYCCITKELFRYPVLCTDGQTYERSAILDWLENHEERSPVTRELMHPVLLPQPEFRDMILTDIKQKCNNNAKREIFYSLISLDSILFLDASKRACPKDIHIRDFITDLQIELQLSNTVTFVSPIQFLVGYHILGCANDDNMAELYFMKNSDLKKKLAIFINCMTEQIDYELSPKTIGYRDNPFYQVLNLSYRSKEIQVSHPEWLPPLYYLIFYKIGVSPCSKHPSKDLFYFIAFLCAYIKDIINLENLDEESDVQNKLLFALYSVIQTTDSDLIDKINQINPQFTWGENENEKLQSVAVLITHMNNIKIMSELLKRGMNPDLRNPRSNISAIHIAIQQENVVFIRELINYDANLDIKDKNGKNAYDYSEENILILYIVESTVEYKNIINEINEIKETNLKLEQRVSEIENKHIKNLNKLYDILNNSIQILSDKTEIDIDDNDE